MPQSMPNSGNGVVNSRKPLSAGFGSDSQVRPYPAARLLLQKLPLRRCTDPLLTVTTVSATTTNFEYLITHSGGNHTYIITRQGIRRQN